MLTIKERNELSRANARTRFARTQKEAGWHHPYEWEDKEDGRGWVAAVIWAIIGAFIFWLFLTLVLA